MKTKKLMRQGRSQNYIRPPNPLQGYTGPIKLPSDGQPTQPILSNITQTTNATQSAGGVMTSYYNTDLVRTTTDWQNFADIYQEYRVLGMQVKYNPFYNNTYNAQLLHSEGAIAYSHVPLSAVPASLDELLQTTSWKVMNSGKPVVSNWRASGTEELQYSSTNDAFNHGGFQYYLANLSNSTTYGRFYITYLVEFRSRK